MNRSIKRVLFADAAFAHRATLTLATISDYEMERVMFGEQKPERRPALCLHFANIVAKQVHGLTAAALDRVSKFPHCEFDDGVVGAAIVELREAAANIQLMAGAAVGSGKPPRCFGEGGPLAVALLLMDGDQFSPQFSITTQV